MTESWDVIVVGAGMGGLSAAARLVREGLRVLVLEKSPHPGGTAYIYRRKGFTFPMGPLGLSTPALVQQTLRDLDVAVDGEFRRVHYQVRAFGVSPVLSRPFRLLADDLTTAFPADRPGITRFFADMERTLAAMQSPGREESRMLLEEVKGISARQYLESFISDWRLRRILGSLGTWEPYSSIPLMAAMWNLMSIEGIWYPPGGMRTLCDRLSQAVTRPRPSGNGLGEIRLGAQVEQIRTGHGRVSGVRLRGGNLIEAQHVISNADFKTTFLKLLRPESLPESWRQEVARARQTGSVLQVALGVETPKVDLSAFSDASRLLYRKDTGEPGPETADWNAQEVNGCALARQELELALMTREDPGLAPGGQSVILIRTEADYGHFSPYRSLERRRKPAYGPYKTGLAKALTQEAAKVIPGLAEAIVVMDVATPLTFEDQGGRSQGAVAGWSWDYEDMSDDAPNALIRTPVQRLYMAGYQAYSNLFMGGVPTALESGRKAAEAVLANAGPVQALELPGSR